MEWSGRFWSRRPGRSLIAIGLTAVAVTALTAASASAATGSTWTQVKVSLPANADHTYAELSSVSCHSSVCAAVGAYTGAAGYRGLLATRLSAKSGWKAVQAPLPAGAAADPFATLTAVACGSTTRCAAVGSYYLPSGRLQAVLLTGLGSRWTAVRPPLPAGGGDATVDAVACASASFCVAGGSYYNSHGEQGLLLTWSGRSWTAATASWPTATFTDPDGVVTDVTCPSAKACVATGDYTDSEQNSQSALLSGAGSSWTTAAPGAADLIVGPVACLSPARCVAAGSNDERSMLVTGSGKSWQAVSPPLPANTTSEHLASLSSIACGPSACVADGTYDATVDSQVETQGVLLSGSGTSWQAAQAPLPPNQRMNPGPGLSNVACPSASACQVIGNYELAAGYRGGMALSGLGSSWQATSTPQPSGAVPSIYTQPSSLACASATTCFEVSSYTQLSGNVQALILSS
jgi:hypothetical protein